MGRHFKSAARWATAAAAATTAAIAQVATPAKADSLIINRAEYADRLRGMWLGEAQANRTGRMTEGARQGTDLVNLPFYTDANWGDPNYTNPYYGQPIGFNFESPWNPDDDTDVEYAYVHVMTQGQSPMLTEQQLTTAWKDHMSQWLFFSNATARQLIRERNVSPLAAGMAAANPCSHLIDAQLTTEVFGALAPGRPDLGLRYGMGPMLVTSRGYATHAAQYYNAMFSLAAAVPSNLAPAEKLRWLSSEARGYIPNTSKAADIIDFVTSEYNANPDDSHWTQTRDKIFQRYQQNASANGFVHRGWIESSVNLATGVMALLYGHGDYRRTVQIATLSGWDSDNGTASLGGLFGLVFGRQHIIDQFAPEERIDRYTMTTVPISDDFHTTATGLTNIPDYVPGVDGVEDTFDMLSQRMLPLVDKAVLEAGGTVDLASNTWTIPLPGPGVDKLALSPTEQLTRHSANNMVRRLGGTVTANSSATGQSPADAAKLHLIADGFETDFSGREYDSADKDGQWYSTVAPGNAASTQQWLSVTYSLPLWTNAVRFTEGDSLTSAGGSFGDIRLELLVNGVWTPAPAGTTLDEPLDPNAPFQLLDFKLPYPLQVTGVRVLGASGASTFAVSAAELDATRLTPVYWNAGGSGTWDGTTVNLTADATVRATTDAYDVVNFATPGTYTVNISGTRTAAQVNIDQGHVTFADGMLAIGSFNVAAGAGATVASVVSGDVGSGGGLFKSGAGTLTLTGANTYAGGTTVNAGTLVLAHADALAGGALAVADGATAQIQPGLLKAVTIASLTTTGSGQLDVTNNALVFREMTAAQVRSAIASGFAAGAWTGGGITSSDAASDAGDATAIGYATAGELGRSEFKGVSGLVASNVLARLTYVGDADLNGVTSLDDFTLFLSGYQNNGTTWLTGDFDYNGAVTLDDFTLFLHGYQHQGASLSQLEGMINALPGLTSAERASMLQAVQAVPEPSAGGAAAVAFIALSHALPRRRRRR